LPIGWQLAVLYELVLLAARRVERRNSIHVLLGRTFHESILVSILHVTLWLVSKGHIVVMKDRVVRCFFDKHPAVVVAVVKEVADLVCLFILTVLKLAGICFVLKTLAQALVLSSH
jgi:hypothetical protein